MFHFAKSLPPKNHPDLNCWLPIYRIGLFALILAVAIDQGSAFAQSQWQVNTQDPAKIFFEGRVGIGFNNPADLLHVSSSANPAIRISGGQFRAQMAMATHNNAFSSLASQGALVLRNVTGGDVVVAASVDGVLRFGTAAGGNSHIERLTVLANGNIGIGIATPDEKLAVKGTVRAQEVVVTQTGWPDFVFEEGYDLMPLDDVEAAVLEDGHLPGIPSAEEVAETGLDVGEMQALLLQKIEELTLYMIDLKKKEDELRARLDVLDPSNAPVAAN